MGAPIRVNNASTRGGSVKASTATGTTTTVKWSGTPLGFPSTTPTTTNPWKVTLAPTTTTAEIIYVTSGLTTTGSGKKATCVRARETTTGRTHSSVAWCSAPTALDFCSIGTSFAAANVTLVATTPHNVSSKTLPPGTWTLICQVTVTANTNQITAWLSTTSASRTGVIGGTYGKAAASMCLTFSCQVSPTTTTTYYLVAQSNGSGSVVHHTASSIPKMSGFNAIRTGGI